ncbi:MAG: hypothetical protein EOP06_12970 [Proteobacteria bacterium]|nr:MAG: hypothetical protein EOP06_12970 [Pseudomonadota bacterium]
MRLVLTGTICLFVSGCATHAPSEQIAETPAQSRKNPYDIDLTNIQDTAEISARAQWCGFDYEPLYLTSMQFERLDTGKTQMQLAQLGYMHGAMLTENANSLASQKCESKDRTKLKEDYVSKLKALCRRENERESLKANCSDAGKILR